MPRTRTPYHSEFQEQVVALARAGRSVEDLAREFEPCAATIHGWIKQADRDGGHRAGNGKAAWSRDNPGEPFLDIDAQSRIQRKLRNFRTPA